jgi:hypothetical protein
MFIRELSTIPYNVKTYLIISDNGEEVCNYINDTYNPIEKVDNKNDSAAFQVSIEVLNEKTKYISTICFLWIHEKYLKKYLSHELIHLSWDILDVVGVKINNNNHEALTYYFDYLLEQCNNFIKEYGKFKRDNKK